MISYYRFIIKHDYLVGYEGECDPSIESCFIGCEDDECTEEYFYSKVQKYAPDLFKECGEDISGCESASKCLSEDKQCSIVYCDPVIDGDVCITSTDIDITEDVGLASSTEDSLLLDNKNSD